MKKNLLIIAAIASATLVSCSSDEFGGEENYPIPVQDAPIAFGSYFKAMTRADLTGAEAAALLDNKFVVSGYKGTQTTWDATKNNMVFDNYLVEYTENTANTTESNTENWEYVGKGRIKHAIDAGITAQKIKYWDYSQPQYDFIAWSTGKKTAIYEGTPTDDEQVLVSAITPSTATTAAYTFTGTAEALSNCYIADLVTVKKDAAGTYGEVAGYNKPVTFKFRQLGTKVRIALYETVPGYSVKNVQFYSAAASDDASATAAKLFTTTANNIFTKGTYTVSFPTVDTPDDADNNQAHVDFVGDGNQSTTIEWGTVDYTLAEDGEHSNEEIYLGRTSNTASFAGNPDKNYYVIYLPNSKGTNLNLRVNYTLESTDGSGEEINVKGATAQVPSIYTQWKPGFAYTYLFKISDKTNGFTGAYDPTNPDGATVDSNPAGLYPITFDAVVVNAEDGNNTQETITTVSTPSITTYQEGSNVVNANEYEAATGYIFVTVNDGNAGSTPDLAHGALQNLNGKAKVYSLSEDKTEAEVIDALQMQDDDAAQGTIKGRSGLVLTEVSSTLFANIRYGVDGNHIYVGTDKALRFTPEAGTTYAFVYTKSAPTQNGTTNIYQAVTKANDADVAGLYRYKLVAATAGDVQKGVKYFENEDASTGMITAFLGQGVSNLYTRSGAGTDADPYVYTIASGYAKTGTTYYYTTDNGMTYKDAAVISFADFNGAGVLYKDPERTIAKTETYPQDGQAYYTATGKYCVIYPQQTTGLYVIEAEDPNDASANKVACGDNDKAVNGMTYFDMYTQNDGVYYAKVIKVQ